MKELLELLSTAHFSLNTKTGERLRNVWGKASGENDMEKIFPNFDREPIGEIFSRSACRFWQLDKSECITSITKYIEDGELVPYSTMIGFFVAWVNADIQHPKVEELARYFVKHKIFEYPLDMSASDYSEKSKPKIPNRPKKDIIECLNSLMGFFETRSINGTAKLLGVDRKTVRSNLTRLVGEGNPFEELISEKFKHYGSIKELHEKWEFKKA